MQYRLTVRRVLQNLIDETENMRKNGNIINDHERRYILLIIDWNLAPEKKESYHHMNWDAWLCLRMRGTGLRSTCQIMHTLRIRDGERREEMDAS